MKADGVIFFGDVNPSVILSMGLPAVLVELKEPIAYYPSVAVDVESLGKMAAEYLLHLGLQDFAYYGFEDARQRGKPFCEAIRKTGREVSLYELPEYLSPQAWDQNKRSLVQWLRSLPKPVGLFAHNDECAQNVMEACRDGGLKVPDEVAVLGVDNDPLFCELADPPLSSVVLDFHKAGYEAAAMLDKLMKGKRLTRSKVLVEPLYIVPRRSTDVLALKDPEILQAVRFIHQNAVHAIQIDDVAEAAALSRRNLTKRFRETLGHSVHEEIRRVRVERIVKLLLETNLSIHQIAEELEFTSPEHISRFFTKEKGITPLAFRRGHLTP